MPCPKAPFDRTLATGKPAAAVDCQAAWCPTCKVIVVAVALVVRVLEEGLEA